MAFRFLCFLNGATNPELKALCLGEAKMAARTINVVLLWYHFPKLFALFQKDRVES